MYITDITESEHHSGCRRSEKVPLTESLIAVVQAGPWHVQHHPAMLGVHWDQWKPIPIYAIMLGHLLCPYHSQLGSHCTSYRPP